MQHQAPALGLGTLFPIPGTMRYVNKVGRSDDGLLVRATTFPTPSYYSPTTELYSQNTWHPNHYPKSQLHLDFVWTIAHEAYHQRRYWEAGGFYGAPPVRGEPGWEEEEADADTWGRAAAQWRRFLDATGVWDQRNLSGMPEELR